MFKLLFFVVVLLIGAALGALGRSWLDGQGAPGQDVRVPATSVAAPPTSEPPRPAAAQPSDANPRDMVVEVTEGELQTQLNTMLVGQSLGTTPLGDTTIQSVTVALRDRQVKVGGAARAGPVQAPFTAAGTVSPDGNGRPLVNVNEATVGGMQLPEGVRDALANSLQTQVDGLFVARSMKVRTIDIMDGTMRVVGTVGS